MKVWKDSTSLGIGVTESDDEYVVVCNYFKAGNVIGQFEKNVSPRLEIVSTEVLLLSKFIYFI